MTAVNVELIRPEYRPKSSDKKRIEKCRVLKVYENSALLDITETDILQVYKNEFNNRIVVSLRKLIWEGTTVKQAVPDKKSSKDKLEAMIIKELKNGHSTLRSIAAIVWYISSHRSENQKQVEAQQVSNICGSSS